MKRILGALFSVILLLALVPTQALGEHLSGGSNWTVTYNADGDMVDNYSDVEYIDQVKDLQPGDDITFTITLKHEYENAADWYMKNDVISSLEKSAGDEESVGSSYGYLLTYEGPGGTNRTLYDSSTVGGDDTNADDKKQGLEYATDGLEEYLFLQNLSKGQEGKLTLVVSLDGETEGNAYFNTLAKLKFGFAVEEDVKGANTPSPKAPKAGSTTKPRSSTSTSPARRLTELVRTGDETRLFPFYIAMVVSGMLMLVLAIVSYRERKKEREEA